MISPQDRCLFSCVSSTRSAHKKPFHSNKTALCARLCARVCANVRACRTHRASESLRDHLFARAQSAAFMPAACAPRAVAGRKSLLGSALNAKHVAGLRVCSHRRDQASSHTFSYASRAAHTQSDSPENTTRFTQFIRR